MKKLSAAVFFLLFLAAVHTASGQAERAEMLSALKDPHTPAEAVDAMLPRLIAMEKETILNPDSQQVAMDIFLQASYAYARNYHFKQGVLVYRGYLGLKDKFAALDKNSAVQALLAKNRDSRAALDEEIVQKKSESGQLESDTAYWQKMNGKFSRNYSLVVILATAVLALVLIRINMNAVKARHSLDGNRKRMLEMQRLAVLGRFYAGTLFLLRSSSSELIQKSEALSEYTRQQHASSGNIAGRVTELMKKVGQVQSQMSELLASAKS